MSEELVVNIPLLSVQWCLKVAWENFVLCSSEDFPVIWWHGLEALPHDHCPWPWTSSISLETKCTKLWRHLVQKEGARLWMLKDQGRAIARISRLRCSSKHSHLVQPGPCVVKPCPGILHMALCLSTSWSPKIAFLLDIVKAPLREQLACLRWVCFEGPTQLKAELILEMRVAVIWLLHLPNSEERLTQMLVAEMTSVVPMNTPATLIMKLIPPGWQLGAIALETQEVMCEGVG